MALDTFQKQGSAVHLGIPFRVWQTAPATIGQGEQQSLLSLCSTPLADELAIPDISGQNPLAAAQLSALAAGFASSNPPPIL
jgi:hypothetical protein